MMPFWTERPDRPPYRCPLTLQDQPADGPFYNTSLQFFGVHDVGDGPRPGNLETVFLSPQAIREACGAVGSPLVAFSRDEIADRNAHIEHLEDECADLSAQLEEAQARVAELENNLKPEEFAKAAVVYLDERYAKKAGPKPRSAA
jgi:hypothetical protein